MALVKAGASILEEICPIYAPIPDLMLLLYAFTNDLLDLWTNTIDQKVSKREVRNFNRFKTSLYRFNRFRPIVAYFGVFGPPLIKEKILKWELKMCCKVSLIMRNFETIFRPVS